MIVRLLCLAHDLSVRQETTELPELMATLHLAHPVRLSTVNEQELNYRLRVAERERDDAVHRAETAVEDARRKENEIEKTKASLSSQLRDCERRNRRLTSEVEAANDERLRALQTLDAMEDKLKQTLDAKEAMERHAASELAALCRQRDVVVADLEERLGTAEAIHVKTVQELQDLLNSQRSMTAKVIQESKKGSAKAEGLIRETKEQNSRLAVRVDELNAHVARLIQERGGFLEQQERDKRTMATLRASVDDANRRGDQAHAQVSARLMLGLCSCGWFASVVVCGWGTDWCWCVVCASYCLLCDQVRRETLLLACFLTRARAPP